MNLCVAAYPELSPDDYARIQAFRKRNDAYYRVVEPHFTLIFPTDEWEVVPFIAEVRKQSAGFPAFDFCIRGAALNRDISGDYFHALLVPDEGHSQFLKLRYKLCVDRFFSYRALEVDFIPHMGVGNSKDRLRCLRMVESWNVADFAIPGRISCMDVANYENDTVETIQRIPLTQ